MGTREISGVVKLLGNSRVSNGNYRNYSLIEFEDGSIVDSVLVSHKMDNFLQRSVDGKIKTSLWLSGDRLVGLTIDGKAYVDRTGYQSSFSSIVSILICSGLCIFLIGIPLLWAAVSNIQNSRAIDQFQQMNPTAVVL
jgi:hypothetical protein